MTSLRITVNWPCQYWLPFALGQKRAVSAALSQVLIVNLFFLFFPFLKADFIVAICYKIV